jgi:hypothetical protein
MNLERTWNEETAMSNLFVLPNLASQNRDRAVHLMSSGTLQAPGFQGLSESSEPVDQIIANAANANNAVLAYSHAVASTKLPFVPQSPAWYNEFTKRYGQIGTNALVWQNSLSPRLIAIPKTIVNYGTLFDLRRHHLLQYSDLLIGDPDNMPIRNALRDTLLSLITEIGNQQTLIDTFGTDLSGFSHTLQDDAAIMAQCVEDAKKEIGRDQARIQALHETIGALRREVASWNQVISAAQIIRRVSFFFGLIGLAVAFASGPFGMAVVALGSIGSAASVGLRLIAMLKIQQLGGQITRQSGELESVQRRLFALQSVQTNVDSLIRLSGTAQAEIGKLLAAWDLMKGGIKAVADDLGNARQRFDALQFVDMRTEFVKAGEDWKVLVERARPFTRIHTTLENEIALVEDRKAA